MNQTIHHLKIHPEPFAAVRRGDKMYEIRVNDRDFKVGDTVVLEEWNPNTGKYTGEEQVHSITYMTLGGSWGLPDELCVFSLSLLTQAEYEDVAQRRLL